MRLSEWHPWIYAFRVGQLQLNRTLSDRFSAIRLATSRTADPLPVQCMRYQSLLRRRLGDTDPQLQENKVVNLRLAVDTMDGVLIRPGETFSFWRLVGSPTARKGYLPGLVLRNGEAGVGTGGGLCQLSNLLYWMALHSPLRAVERHHHSFDAFPDAFRVVPFGTGACVFYNYVDLRLYNPTEITFQFRIVVGEQHLKGELLADRELPVTYEIHERGHRFVQVGQRTYRENEIWRSQIDRATGAALDEQKLMHNFCEVKYKADAVAP
ncbi:MAG: VanW family protein [Mycobacterium leprae]